MPFLPLFFIASIRLILKDVVDMPSIVIIKVMESRIKSKKETMKNIMSAGTE